MLNEGHHIDQLFRTTLGELEKTPPVSVWSGIEQRLDAQKGVLRLNRLKTIGVAAALLIALFAGWWLFNPADIRIATQTGITEQKASMVNPETIVSNTPGNQRTSEAGKIDSNRSESSDSTRFEVPRKVSSLAAFAANTSFMGHDGGFIQKKPDEPVLSESEKSVLDKFEQNLKMVKKITDWISDKVSNDTVPKSAKEAKSTIFKSLTQISTDKYAVTAMTNPPGSNASRWSLKAEFAPVFNSQVSNRGQISNGSIYPIQRTTSENTVSAGIMAGYKVSKRLIIKSGIGYNNVRQTSRNVLFTATNPLSSINGNTMYASTPAGQVILGKTAVSQMDATLSSGANFQGGSVLSGDNALKQSIGFVEIPLQATYKLIDKKFGVGITGGVSTNIKVGNNAVLTWNGERISSGETSNIRNMVYSGVVGLELGYAVSNRITITVEPRLKHFINSLNTSNSVDYKPNQVEIATGLTYCFN